MQSQPIAAGVVAALVGFASSFTIVLAGLTAVGADESHAASGLLVLSVSMGLVGMWASWRLRLPISIAWSTPGAALLTSSGLVAGGYDAALGAFVLAGTLTVLAGLWRTLGRWIAQIPGPLASALLAGVLLPVCLAPARSVVAAPAVTAPVVVVWILAMRFARRWAVPSALLAAVLSVAIVRPEGTGDFAPRLPHLVFDLPTFHLGTLLGLGIPLFIVTMASQNVAGMAVLRSYGFDPPLRPLLVSTGAATIVGAPFGAHGVNLAALTAALVAGPDAHPRPEERWIAGAVSGATYVVLGLLAGLATAVVATAPSTLVAAVAGLALLPSLAGALAAATADPKARDAAVVTLVVSASGISAFGISAPFWGLAAGLIVHGLARLRTPFADR